MTVDCLHLLVKTITKCFMERIIGMAELACSFSSNCF